MKCEIKYMKYEVKEIIKKITIKVILISIFIYYFLVNYLNEKDLFTVMLLCWIIPILYIIYNAYIQCKYIKKGS